MYFAGNLWYSVHIHHFAEVGDLLMTADCSGIQSSAATGSSGRFLTDRRLKLFFALLLAVTTIIRVMLSVFPKTGMNCFISK